MAPKAVAQHPSASRLGRTLLQAATESNAIAVSYSFSDAPQTVTRITLRCAPSRRIMPVWSDLEQFFSKRESGLGSGIPDLGISRQSIGDKHEQTMGRTIAE